MIEKHIYEVLIRGDEHGLKGASLQEIMIVPDFAPVVGPLHPLPASVDDPTWQALFERLNTEALNQVGDLQTQVSSLTGDLEQAQQTIAEQSGALEQAQQIIAEQAGLIQELQARLPAPSPQLPA